MKKEVSLIEINDVVVELTSIVCPFREGVEIRFKVLDPEARKKVLVTEGIVPELGYGQNAVIEYLRKQLFNS